MFVCNFVACDRPGARKPRRSVRIRSSAVATSQPQYLHNLISVQLCHNTRSSSMVTLARPRTRSSLKITNRSFQYAAPYLWNQLPTKLREPRQILSPSCSPPITHGSSSSLSPLSSCLTHSFFFLLLLLQNL